MVGSTEASVNCSSPFCGYELPSSRTMVTSALPPSALIFPLSRSRRRRSASALAQVRST
ncbi:MAG: hypothetical protein WKG00_39800 [Polyangiaceae bacterium]